jgi:hypothetical protein
LYCILRLQRWLRDGGLRRLHQKEVDFGDFLSQDSHMFRNKDLLFFEDEIKLTEDQTRETGSKASMFGLVELSREIM